MCYKVPGLIWSIFEYVRILAVTMWSSFACQVIISVIMITCSHRGRTSRWEKVVAVFRLFLVCELGSPEYDEIGDYDADDDGQKDENFNYDDMMPMMMVRSQ